MGDAADLFRSALHDEPTGGISPLGIGFGVLSSLGAAGQFVGQLMGNEARREEFNQRIAALDQKRNYTLSLANAKAAASGITLDSLSVDNYLSELSKQFDMERRRLLDAKDQSYTAGIVGAVGGLVGNAAQTVLGFRGIG